MLRMARYGKTRFWALWDDQELVAVVVYKRGAAELLRRLAAQPPPWRLPCGRPRSWPSTPGRWRSRPRPPPRRCGHAPSLAARRERLAADAASPASPLVARSWRAITPGQREAPTPTTSPGDARKLRTARLPWTAPQ